MLLHFVEHLINTFFEAGWIHRSILVVTNLVKELSILADNLLFFCAFGTGLQILLVHQIVVQIRNTQQKLQACI